MTSIESQRQELEQARATLPAAPKGLREDALEKFSTLGYPTTRIEDWKYTNLREIAEGDFPFRSGGTQLSADDIDRIRQEINGVTGLVFVDGAAATDFPPATDATTSFASPLADALERDAAAVEAAIAALVEIERSSLVALNTAFLGAGAFIQIPDDTVVEKPIHIIYATTPGSQGLAHHVRNLIAVGRNSRVDIVESYLGLGDGKHWTNSATDIVLADGAKLGHCKIQREAMGSYHTADIAATQGADSSWHSVSISLGARLCRTDIRSRLAAPGARCSLDGLYMADASQHVDHHTTIDHAAPRCTSDELYKGILGGSATGVFNGKVLVRNEGQRTDSQQLNKNLLLSDSASINTKPQLEIFADDVKCSHGATTGRLDPDAIFFLRSRGLDEPAARALLTYAFANEVVERIDAEMLRERLERIVRERLTAIGASRGRS